MPVKSSRARPIFARLIAFSHYGPTFPVASRHCGGCLNIPLAVRRSVFRRTSGKRTGPALRGRSFFGQRGGDGRFSQSQPPGAKPHPRAAGNWPRPRRGERVAAGGVIEDAGDIRLCDGWQRNVRKRSRVRGSVVCRGLPEGCMMDTSRSRGTSSAWQRFTPECRPPLGGCGPGLLPSALATAPPASALLPARLASVKRG